MIKDSEAVILFLGTLFVGGLIGMMVGGCVTQDHERGQAIKAGVAHYSVNPQTGYTKFVYGVPPK
jgi:hypothetical protein